MCLCVCVYTRARVWEGYVYKPIFDLYHAASLSWAWMCGLKDIDQYQISGRGRRTTRVWTC